MALVERGKEFLACPFWGDTANSLWDYSYSQPAHFGRVYAAYGGIFIVPSILWGWQVDDVPPDRFDLIGGTITLIGVFIIMYWPR